jgi:hypothetical protein
VLAFAERPVTLTGSVRHMCVREGRSEEFRPEASLAFISARQCTFSEGRSISRRFAFYRDLPRIESNKWIRLKRILSGHSNQRLTKNTQKAMQQRI